MYLLTLGPAIRCSPDMPVPFPALPRTAVCACASLARVPTTRTGSGPHIRPGLHSLVLFKTLPCGP